MANKKVHIFEADGEYRVQPPLLELDGSGGGDTITMKNNTGEDLVVYFPPKACVAATAGDPVAIPLDKGKKITATAASQGAGNSNLYAYQVIAPKSGKKAKGNSDPVLIIEN
jgi:hypothetical protein